MISGDSNRRPLLSLANLTPKDIVDIGSIALRYGRTPEMFTDRLHRTKVGLLFTAPSTRTRISFWAAAIRLGCDVIHLNQADVQIATGETWSDTGAVLANYLDIVVARTNGPQLHLAELAVHVPATIDALTLEDHPTQAVADYCAISERFGDVKGLRLAYLGEVSNTARALAYLVCKLPFCNLDVYSPKSTGFSPQEISSLNALSGREAIHQYHKVPESPNKVDVVYTTRWNSMSAAREDNYWLSQFSEFAVTKDLIRRFSGSREAIFMHDLPAVRGQEVTSDVLDGINVTSLVQRQIYHKESAAAAALIWTTGASS